MIKHNLIDYLPDYYYDSRQMKAIMHSARVHIPDAEQVLWKAFFLCLDSDWSRDLWREELNAKTDDPSLYGLLRSRVFNKEFTESMGMTVRETWRDMPYDGLTLSDDGYMADGFEYNVLTSIITADVDNFRWEMFKKIVNFLRAVGYEYLFELTSQYYIKMPDPKIDSLHTVILGVPDPQIHSFEENISGDKMVCDTYMSVHLFSMISSKRSYNFDSTSIFFNNETIDFSMGENSRQLCEIKKGYSEYIESYIPLDIKTSVTITDSDTIVCDDNVKVSTALTVGQTAYCEFKNSPTMDSKIIMFNDERVTFDGSEYPSAICDIKIFRE